MADIETTQDILTHMFSHSIMDAEYIAAKLRMQGWKCIQDRNLDKEDMTGGAYLVRTPEGKEGQLSWYTPDEVARLSGSAQYFQEGIPRALMLGSILAVELVIIVRPILDVTKDWDRILAPGELFKRALEEVGIEVLPLPKHEMPQ